MLKRFLSFIVSLLFLTSWLFGQEWYDMIQDPNANFFEIQQSAERYFQVYGTGKGTGWKQYKRWEYMHGLRIGPDGSMLHPDEILSELRRYEATHPADKRSSNQGNWRELGPTRLPGNGTGQPNGMGRINCLTFHPTDTNLVFAGAPSGGIWQSNDKGQNWFKVSQGLTRLGVSSIVIHPGSPNIMYLGTGDRDAGDAPGYGVWRSTDGGNSWQPYNNGMGNRTVYEILMHPANPDILIAATQSRIYRSTDGGANWSLTYNGHSCKDLAFHPGNPDIVYASGSIFLRSTDNGQSFQRVTNGLPVLDVVRMALGVSPAQPGWVYVLVARNGNTGFEGLYRSTDNGLSFVQQSSSPNILGYDTNGGWGNQGWYDLCMVVDKTNANTLYTGGINVWKSTDGGISWSPKTHWWGSGGLPSVHADDHALEWSPHTDELWLGNDGGVYVSNNDGDTWNRISQGLAIAQVYKIGQSASERNLVINGYQDNGTAILRGDSWNTEIGGDGMECIIDPVDPGVMYGSLYYGDIRRSMDGGNSFVTIAANGLGTINEGGGWVTPYKLHPSNPNIMFIGYWNVWRSTNVKANPSSLILWEKISSFPNLSALTDLAISPADTTVMMVSKSGGPNRLYLCQNALAASPSWIPIALPVNNQTPRDIEFHPTNRNTLWIAMGNEIYRTDNLGQSWTQVSGTLPNLPINTIVADAESSVEAVYIGTDAGVFYRDSSLPDWISFSTNLPPVEVTELEIFYDPQCGDAVLRASTYGRGLWESDLRDPGTEPPFACFSVSPKEICEGSVISFTDESSYGPTSWSWSITPYQGISFINNTTANSPSPRVRFESGGLYTISLTVTNARGADTLVKEDHIVVGTGSLVLPYSMNFDNASLCNIASDCGRTTCPLPAGWSNATNGQNDDIDWRVHEGATPSSSTGPRFDSNTGTLAGKYIYLEASGGCTFQEAQLISPCLDLRYVGNPGFTFDAHMYGSRVGDLHLDIFHNGVWTEDVISPVIGNQGDRWISRSVNLGSYAGSVIRLRFRGITGGGYDSDMALDNFQLTGVSLATEVVNFRGRFLSGLGNHLAWEAENITPGELFVVQRRNAETGEFEDLADQPVTRATHYEWLDPKPQTGPNYYRLAVFTVDGTWDYFETIEVVAEADPFSLEVFPNPAAESITVEFTRNTFEPLPIELRDMQGRLLLQKMASPSGRTSRHELNLRELAPGMYIVVVQGEARRVLKR